MRGVVRSRFAGSDPDVAEVIEAVGHRSAEHRAQDSELRDEGLASGRAHRRGQHLLDRVVVSSFNPLALRRVRQLNPWIPIGLLYAPTAPSCADPGLATCSSPKPSTHTTADGDDQYVRWAREQGYRVHTWTVDDPEDVAAHAARVDSSSPTGRPAETGLLTSPREPQSRRRGCPCSCSQEAEAAGFKWTTWCGCANPIRAAATNGGWCALVPTSASSVRSAADGCCWTAGLSTSESRL